MKSSTSQNMLYFKNILELNPIFKVRLHGTSWANLNRIKHGSSQTDALARIQKFGQFYITGHKLTEEEEDGDGHSELEHRFVVSQVPDQVVLLKAASDRVHGAHVQAQRDQEDHSDGN